MVAIHPFWLFGCTSHFFLDLVFLYWLTFCSYGYLLCRDHFLLAAFFLETLHLLFFFTSFWPTIALNYMTYCYASSFARSWYVAFRQADLKIEHVFRSELANACAEGYLKTADAFCSDQIFSHADSFCSGSTSILQWTTHEMFLVLRVPFAQLR